MGRRLTEDASDGRSRVSLYRVQRAREVPEVVEEHLSLRRAEQDRPPVRDELDRRQRKVRADELLHRPLRVDVVEDALLVEPAGEDEAAVDGRERHAGAGRGMLRKTFDDRVRVAVEKGDGAGEGAGGKEGDARGHRAVPQAADLVATAGYRAAHVVGHAVEEVDGAVFTSCRDVAVVEVGGQAGWPISESELFDGFSPGHVIQGNLITMGNLNQEVGCKVTYVL